MTILEAMVQADALRPNSLDEAVKLQWLSGLDGQLLREVLAPCGEGAADFAGYGPETELRTTQLLVGYPYDELYPQYLAMRIDLAHGELERYNNDAAWFNRLYRSWAASYAAGHRPQGVDRLRF